MKLRVLVFSTNVMIEPRISSPCKGEVPSLYPKGTGSAERVLLEKIYKVFNYEYKERKHEKNNSGAGVGGVTECV